MEKWAHGPTGRRQLRMLRIRVQLPVSPLQKNNCPVVQWQRRLAHIQETMVQLRPGLLFIRGAYANRKSDHVESVMILWVQLPPRSLKSRELRAEGREPEKMHVTPRVSEGERRED
jgi:hypothetical protein